MRCDKIKAMSYELTKMKRTEQIRIRLEETLLFKTKKFKQSELYEISTQVDNL